jgi:hypothetical protein
MPVKAYPPRDATLSTLSTDAVAKKAKLAKPEKVDTESLTG